MQEHKHELTRGIYFFSEGGDYNRATTGSKLLTYDGSLDTTTAGGGDSQNLQPYLSFNYIVKH